EERMHKGQANVANIRAMLAKAFVRGYRCRFYGGR
ncbi:hypothetical protein, partial [Enterobacter sp. APAP_BS8]